MSQDTSKNSLSGPERVVRIGRLLDLYGNLLTDRQRDFIRMHYEDDLSFGEIGKEFGISRQAVHDAVKHAETSLEHYEAKLALSPKRRHRTSGDDIASSAPEEPGDAPAAVDGLEPCIGLLEEIQDRLRRSGGVLYNVDGVQRDLGDAIDKLRRLQAPAKK
ncbi:YlxM family DNA-binding protein [Candidatus Sumerlaeota bacterium]|nr:YlxM family DNA-binding protein [Candidatus Sumerlaeota bacterium]